MLGAPELRTWVDHFGTPESQVRRDHLISHLLLRLPDLAPDATFFGGTALCRTHLPEWRLSEDIDLLVDAAAPIMRAFDDQLSRLLRREYPGLAVRRGGQDRNCFGTIAVDDLSVRIQLVERDSGYRCYPTALMPVALRYSDLPSSVELICPTRDAAAAMKLAAWSERAAPRDLCDLFGLVQVRALRRNALDIMAAAAWPIQRHDFDDERLPSEDAWQAALGGQMANPPPRQSAFASVRGVVAELAQWNRARNST